MGRMVAAVGAAALLSLGGAGCSDEDGDGNVTDEETENLEERGRDAGDEIDQQIDEGAEEDDEGAEEDGEN